MGNLVTPRAEAPRLDRRMRTTLIIVGIVAVIGLAVTAWLQLAAPPADRPGDAGTTTAPDAAATSGPVPGAAPVAGSEVQDPGSTRAPIDRIPPRTAAAPRVAEPLPPTASRTGGLVDGLPAAVAAPATGSDVLDSSVASEGTTLQFSLRARTDASAAEVLGHYDALWTSLGLVADGTAYRDAYSSVSVTADESSGTGTVYTVSGVLRAA